MSPERLTVSVPEAGRLLGIGRDASYAAAARGEIPTLRLGRRLVVPVAKLRELVGLPQDVSDGPDATSEPTATTDPTTEATPHEEHPEVCGTVRPLRNAG